MNRYLQINYPSLGPFCNSNAARAWLTRTLQESLGAGVPLPDWFKLFSGHAERRPGALPLADGPYPFRIHRGRGAGLTFTIVGSSHIQTFYAHKMELDQVLRAGQSGRLPSESQEGELEIYTGKLHPVRYHQLILEKGRCNLRQTLGEIALEEPNFSFPPLDDPRYQDERLLEFVRGKLVAGVRRQAALVDLEVPLDLVLGEVRVTGRSLIGVGPGKTLLSALDGTAQTNAYLVGPWALGRLASKGCGRLSLPPSRALLRTKATLALVAD